MVIKKKPAGKKAKAPKIVTPIGRLSYPYLNEPDSGRENSDNKYKTDLLIPKATWKAEGKTLKEAVLAVGREFYKDKSLELSDFANPFKDTDKLEKYSDIEEVKGCILIRCKSEFKPTLVNAQKEEMSEAQRKEIKGGDYARLVVAVYPYPNGEGGVTLGLNLVQFVKPGEAFGGGKAAALAQIDEIEIEPDDIDTEDSEEDEEEVPVRKPKKTPSSTKEYYGRAPLKNGTDEDMDRKVAGEYDDEDEDEDEEEEPAPKKKSKKAKPSKDKDEEEEFNFDDEDDGA